MSKPYFSVVIPTYNRSLLLKRAIDSVLSQTFQNFELIVVDDHSTDNTASVVNKIKDPRLKYCLNQRKKGACGARNTGIFQSKGGWVAFLDDDDVWYNEKLEIQHGIIVNSKSNVGLVCSDYAIKKGRGSKLIIVKSRPEGWVHEKILFGEVIVCLPSTCVKKNILLAIGGFDESFPACQDQDFYLRISEVAEFVSAKKTLVCTYQEKRKRISHDHESKLIGHILLKNKYIRKIEKSNRLKHRHNSQVFTYALILKRKNLVIESMPWFLLGLITDFPRCFLSFRTAIILFFRLREKIFSTPWN